MAVPVGGYSHDRMAFVAEKRAQLKINHPNWSKRALDRAALEAWWSLTHTERHRLNKSRSAAVQHIIRRPPKTKWTAWKVYCTDERLDDYRTTLNGKPGLVRRGLPHNKLLTRLANQFRRLPAVYRQALEAEADGLNRYHGFKPPRSLPSMQDLVNEIQGPTDQSSENPLPQQEIDRHLSHLRPAPAGLQWSFAKNLYASSARISLYTATDAAGHILDREVVKTALEAPILDREPRHHTTAWNAAQLHLAGACIFPLHRAHQLGPHDWDLHLPYTPHGDLHTLIDAHALAARPISEPFLWALFHDLARAIRLLAPPFMGTTPGHAQPITLVHADIKPSNVFLVPASPASTVYAPWRARLPWSAALADFGSARATTPADRWNTRGRFTHEGMTPGFVPPELWGSVTPRDDAEARALPPLTHRVGSAANVWQVGVVMWCLATRCGEGDVRGLEAGRGVLPEGVERVERGAWGEFFLERKGGMVGAYGARLVDLVYACLDVFPEERIGVQELVAEVEEALEVVGREVESGDVEIGDVIVGGETG